MRPDVHHCCLRDRQVKRMLCPVHPPPPPLAVCHLLSHPLSTTQSAVRALGRDYRQLTGLRASVGRALDAGARPTALTARGGGGGLALTKPHPSGRADRGVRAPHATAGPSPHLRSMCTRGLPSASRSRVASSQQSSPAQRRRRAPDVWRFIRPEGRRGAGAGGACEGGCGSGRVDGAAPFDDARLGGGRWGRPDEAVRSELEAEPSIDIPRATGGGGGGYNRS